MYKLAQTRQAAHATDYPYNTLIVRLKDGSDTTVYFDGRQFFDAHPDRLHAAQKKEALRFLADVYGEQWVTATIMHVWGNIPKESFAISMLARE